MTYWLGLPGTVQVIAPRACYKQNKIAEYTEEPRYLGIRIPAVCKKTTAQFFKTLCALKKMCFNKIHIPSTQEAIKLAIYAGWNLNEMMIEMDDDDILDARTYFIKEATQIHFDSSLKCGFKYLGPFFGFIRFDPHPLTDSEIFPNRQEAEKYINNINALIEDIIRQGKDIQSQQTAEPWKQRRDLLTTANHLLQELAKRDSRFSRMTISYGRPADEDLCRCIKEHLAPDFFNNLNEIRKAANSEYTRSEFQFRGDPCLRTAPAKAVPVHALYYDEPQNKALCKSFPGLCNLWLKCFYESLKDQRLLGNEVVSSEQNETIFILGNYAAYSDLIVTEITWSNHRVEWADYADRIFNTSYDDIPIAWEDLSKAKETKLKANGSWVSLFENMDEMQSLFHAADTYNWNELWIFPGSDEEWEELKEDEGFGDVEACKRFLDYAERVCRTARALGWPREGGRLVERYAYRYCKEYPHCEKCDPNDPDDWGEDIPEGFPPIGSSQPPSGGHGYIDPFFGPQGPSNR